LVYFYLPLFPQGANDMSKAEKTRQLIIDKTASIFNTKGYSATSLSDITEATGLTKGSIYGNFKDKDEVVVAAFKHNAGLRSAGLKAIVQQGNNPLVTFKAMIEYYRHSLPSVLLQGGCPMLNAATEADDHLLFLQEPVKQQFLGWQHQFSQVIKAGQAQGLLKAELDAESYALQFIMLIEGGILISRTFEDRKHMNLALDRILLILSTEMQL